MNIHFFSIQVHLTPVSFNTFLRNVIRHCRPNWLTEVEIKLNAHQKQAQFQGDALCEVRPFFQRLEQLTINCKRGSNILNWDNLFLWNSPHLKSLTLEGEQISLNWLQLIPAEFSNISELRLLNVFLRESLNDFRSFLDRLTNLEVFVCIKNVLSTMLDIEEVIDDLAERFPNLRGFGYNIGKTDFHGTNMEFYDRLSSLTKFTNLTELHLGTYYSACENVQNSLRFVPNIKIFGVNSLRLNHMPVEIRRIVRSLKEIVLGRREAVGNLAGGKDFVQLQMNNLQFNDFKTIKNIEFIRPIVHPNIFE